MTAAARSAGGAPVDPARSAGGAPVDPARSAGGARTDAALHSATAHDSGRQPVRRTPVRTCVGCRTRSEADGLLRVVAVNGVLTPDPRRRLPGRGAWLHPVPECLHRAERRSAFSRALRVPGKLDVTAVREHLIVRNGNNAGGIRETPGSVMDESKVDPS